MSITVKFQNEVQKEKKPSEMNSCMPFVAKNKEGQLEVLIRTGGGSYIFFSANGGCSYVLEVNSWWVDENYTALPNEKATVILEV